MTQMTRVRSIRSCLPLRAPGLPGSPRSLPSPGSPVSRGLLVSLGMLGSLSLLGLSAGAVTGAAGPQYTADGSLILPADYREWIFLSSGIDMSYSEKPAMQGMSMFDNVFVDARSWAAFKESGHWPDRTVFAMENRGAATKGSINKQGHFQTTELMGLEFHVRDDARFKGGWGFFASDGTRPATLLATSEACYACHEAHGALDTTFTQFYPTAKQIALAKHSLSDEPLLNKPREDQP